ncbi:MAG: alpha/beta hydrolase [candidate division KSB1 bacterium]|jgi:pimeloyl-ACP methyl ester carboxylesterase|nr:alpha/beta hydrolase [candidate division KSB1 bacterium]
MKKPVNRKKHVYRQKSLIKDKFKMTDNKLPEIVTVPCFSGAPWELEQLKALQHRPLRTMRLPEELDNIENYADFVANQVKDLSSYVLVGDSFGAVVSLAYATRQPKGLEGLVMSGGFAANPVTNPLLKARINAARLLPGPLYRAITLRFHASSLASPHDGDGEIPWSKQKSRDLFVENTPFKSYISRAKAAFSANYLDRLKNINVPTLIITPSYDKLIGEKAAKQMLDGIHDSTEIIIENTGHMFRFSHPETYAAKIEKFLEQRID